MKCKTLILTATILSNVLIVACADDVDLTSQVEDALFTIDENGDRVPRCHKHTKVKDVVIFGVSSERVATVADDSTANEANIGIWSDFNRPSQQWTFYQLYNGYWMIINKNSHKCLDVESGSTADSANVLQHHCNGHRHQQWKVRPRGNGEFELVNRKSRKCLEVEGDAQDDGGNIVQNQCSGVNYQRWRMTQLESDDYSVTGFGLYDASTDTLIRPLVDNDVINLATDGERLSIVALTEGEIRSVVFALNDDDRYKIENYEPYSIAGDIHGNLWTWHVEPGAYTLVATPYNHRWGYGVPGEALQIEFTVEDPDSFVDMSEVSIFPKDGGTVLSVAGASLDDGANIAVLTDFGDSYQEWILDKKWNGSYVILNKNSEKCMVVEDGSFLNGANVEQRRCHRCSRQQWKLEGMGFGEFKIINKRSGKCLAADGDPTVSGTNVHQHTCNNDTNQIWKIEVLHSGDDLIVEEFVLYDSIDDVPLRVLNHGDTIDLNTDGFHLNIVARTAGNVKSVVFGLDNNTDFHTENFRPFALAGDYFGDLRPWTPEPGALRVSATPYTKHYGKGDAGTNLEIEVTVVE